jgi:hypothetical protein
MRNRFGMTAAAGVLAAVLSITVASASSPGANGADLDAAAAPPPTIAPIQQLSLGLGASSDGVARVGDKVGQVPGFCHLHS